MINCLKKIVKNLDIIFSIVGIIVIIGIVSYLILNQYHSIYYVALGIGLVCVCCYLIFRNRLRIQASESINGDYVILVMACFFGLANICIVNLQFPNSLIGLDTWTHMRITTQELDIALNPASNQYGIAYLTLNTIGGYFSLMHLYLRSIIEITGLSYKWASLIFVGSLQTLGTIIFTFLIGKELISQKVGAIASLMVACAGWVIYFGQWVIPNGIGATFSLIVAYLFIKSYKTHRQWIAWLSLPIFIISLFTHILVAVWVVGAMICMSLLPTFLDCIEAHKSLRYRINRIKYSCLLLVICISLSFIWYQSTSIGNAVALAVTDIGSMPSFGVVQPQNNAEVLPNAVESLAMTSNIIIVPIVHDVLNNGNLIELIIDSLGFFSYIGIALIGCLMMLRMPNLNRSWVILCFGALFIGLMPLLIGVQVLKERWWYLSQVFMAIPLAVVLAQTIKDATLNGVIAGIIIVLSIIGLPSNITDRAISKDLIVRYAFTDAELSTKENLSIDLVYEHGGILGADSYYIAYLQSDVEWYWPQRTKVRDIDQHILNGNFKDCPYGIILIREALYNEPFAFGNGSIYKIEYNVLELAKQQGYKEIWNKGGVHCLIRK